MTRLNAVQTFHAKLCIGMLGIAALAGCGGPQTEFAEIIRGALTDNPSMIDVSVAVCTPEPEIDVQETASQVVVTATYRPVRADADCARIVSIELEEPLGDRVVIDGSNGDEVHVDAEVESAD
jgi:hypothetical protein